MAHLRSIRHECDTAGCTAWAVVQLYTEWNEPMSRHCRQHGNAALKGRNAMEDRWHAEQRARGEDHLAEG